MLKIHMWTAALKTLNFYERWMIDSLQQSKLAKGMVASKWIGLQATNNQSERRIQVKMSGIKPKIEQDYFQHDNGHLQIGRSVKL